MVWPLALVDALDVFDEHVDERVLGRRCKEAVSDDRVRLVFGVWFVPAKKTCVLAGIQNILQAL